MVLKHVLLRPMNRCIFVCLRIAEALASARGAPKDAPQGRPLLGIAAFLNGVALRALGLEKLCPLLLVALWHFDVRLRDGHASGSIAGKPTGGERQSSSHQQDASSPDDFSQNGY